MILNYIKEPLYISLVDGIDRSVDKYSNIQPKWVGQHELSSIGVAETGISVSEMRPLIMPTARKGVGLKDLENTKLVYSDLKNLTVSQAQDHRLWAFLTHDSYWDYMQQRWPVTAKSVIKRRYFFESNTKDALIRNGISRLWWFGHLTYDKTLDNPFELTEVLLMNQDIQSALLERSFGRNKALLKTVLRFIRDNPDKFTSGGGMSKSIQRLGVHINLVGGVSLLDCMSEDQLNNIFLSVFN